MGGTCSTCEEEEWHVQGLVGKTEGKNHLEDLGVDGKILLPTALYSGAIPT